jgi:sialate O-acetylesterase
LEALKLPRTAAASALDVGEENDIHPKDKQTVGRRLALAARALVHGEKIEYSGPAFKTAKREGNRVRLLFTHTGSGLATRDGGKVAGFAVRGADANAWKWAETEINGDALVLGHGDVPEIKEVRYAWASFPIANLQNKEGLPANPFRVEIK